MYSLGDTSCNGFFYASNTATFQSDVYCEAQLVVESGTTLESRCEIYGVCQLDSTVTMLGPILYCNADASFNGNVQIKGTSFISNSDSSFNGNVKFNGDNFTCDSTAVFNNKSYLVGDISCNGNIQINQGAIMNGVLTINNDLYVGVEFSSSEYATLRTGYITCYTDFSTNNIYGQNATITTVNSTYLSSSNCNVSNELHMVGGNPIVSLYSPGVSTGAYLWASYSHRNGDVGFATCNDLASPYAGGYTDLYSMDFINNTGSANYSCWNFYSLGNALTTATAYNTIYNGGFAHQSDITIKQNVKNLNTLNSLDKITKIRLVNYQYIDVPNDERIGVISQEVEKISPKSVVMLPHKKDALFII